MANNEYLNDYVQFFQYFADTFDPSDQLPVKLASYKLVQYEVVGAIFNWVNQYLSLKRCPYHLISFLSRIIIENTRKRCKKQPIQCGFDTSKEVYEPLKLMHTVIEITNEVCFSYESSLSVQNSRQNMAVPNPLPSPEAVYNVVSVYAMKNIRRKMEDKYVVVHDLNTIFTKQDATPSHYYAVFDGHDGEEAATYSANHLHQYMAESTNFTTDPEQALRNAFCKTNSMFQIKCRSENIVGGTTAVCALLLPKEKTLYIAWAGDSLAALVSQGQIKHCVVPHKPNRQDEKIRIEKAGGALIHFGVWRVNGQLAVSRAIGDGQHGPCVIADPEIVKISLRSEDDFFVLGSDGFWDHISESEIAKTVYDGIYFDPDEADVSRHLVHLAKRNGSSDNIAVIVVYLKHPRNIAAGPRWTDNKAGMEALDNANEPLVAPNKANGDGGHNEHDNGVEGLLFNNINDDFDALKKKDDTTNNDLIKMLEKSNSARLTPEFDKDDNLGPETDVDNPDGGSASPNVDVMALRSEAINNNQHYNPFNDIGKSLERNLNLKEGTFDGLGSPDEETCPTQTNAVHNVSQLIDAGADSDSEEEEEWNYVSGQEANKENVVPLQLSSKVAEEEEEGDAESAMSQLNPNAAEFVPVSPTRAIASPIGRLLCDEVLSESPKRVPTQEVDLNVPNPVDFENDISQKPHEIDEGISNGHDHQNDDVDVRGLSKNRLDEFHFGPNATPFTPVKLHDQSEASSTRAFYGDESVMTLGTSFNDSQDNLDRADLTAKDDPMTASFHQERDDDSNPFDPNKVHLLPDDDDEDLVGRSNLSYSPMNDTISDLEEHFPLSKPDEDNKPPAGFLVTDLDQDDHRHSSENRTVSPFMSNRTESPSEDRLSASPSDHDKISIPFEEERAVSSVHVSKISSPFEDETESSHLPEKTESPISTLDKADNYRDEVCFIEKGEVMASEDEYIHSPVQDEVIRSAVRETDTKYLIEDNQGKCIVEEKEICCPIELDKEKCTIEEKEASSPLEEEIEKFTLEDNSEIKKEKLIVEEKEASSPLEDEDELSKLRSGHVKSPHDESGIVPTLVEERAVVSPLGERDVISPVNSCVTPVEGRDLASSVEDFLTTSQKQGELGFSMEQIISVEKCAVSTAEEQKSDLFSAEQIIGFSATTHNTEVISFEQKSESIPVEQKSELFSTQQMSEFCCTSNKTEVLPAEPENEVISSEQQAEDISVEQKSELFSTHQMSEFSCTSNKTEVLPAEPENGVISSEQQAEDISVEQKSELFSAHQMSEFSCTSNKTEVLPAEPETEVISSEQQAEDISVEQKSELFSAQQMSEFSCTSNKTEVLPAEPETEVTSEQKSEDISINQKSELFSAEQISVEPKTEVISAELKSENIPVNQNSETIPAEKSKLSLELEDESESESSNLSEDENEDVPIDESQLDENELEEKRLFEATLEAVGQQEQLRSTYVAPIRYRMPVPEEPEYTTEELEEMYGMSVEAMREKIQRQRLADGGVHILGPIKYPINYGDRSFMKDEKLIEDVLAGRVSFNKEAKDFKLLPSFNEHHNNGADSSHNAAVAISSLDLETPVALATADLVSKADEEESRPPSDLPISSVCSDEYDPLHSHPTPECDQLLAEPREPLGSSSLIDSSSVLESSSVVEISSVVETSGVVDSSVEAGSVTTTEVNSFLERSLLQEIQSPLSSNASYAIGEAIEQAPADTSLEPTIDGLSPPRKSVEQFTDLTSTPSNDRPVSLSPLASQVLLDVAAKSPSKLTPKDAEKKTTKSSKTIPSSTTTKKTPTTRSSLSANAKAASPSPRAAAPSKTARPTPTKTDSGASSKAPPKPTAALPKATTALKATSTRVPLTSRPSGKPAPTNGVSSTTSKTSTAAPKKTTEGNASVRSTTMGNRTSTVTSKAPTASSRSTITARTAPSTRSASTTDVPKPRSSTTKPAAPKTSAATKSTSAVKTNSSNTTLKATTAAKPSASSSSNRVPISARSSQLRPAHSTTEKQIKETANKLTASRTTTSTRISTTAKKTDEKTSTTKTTTSRTTVGPAATAPAHRPPIRRPPASSDAKTAATKVGKPKQNGVAAVVTEQIIVNQHDASELNGPGNGDSQFVKDNSPVDNKLIVKSHATTETAAN